MNLVSFLAKLGTTTSDILSLFFLSSEIVVLISWLLSKFRCISIFMKNSVLVKNIFHVFLKSKQIVSLFNLCLQTAVNDALFMQAGSTGSQFINLLGAKICKSSRNGNKQFMMSDFDVMTPTIWVV